MGPFSDKSRLDFNRHEHVLTSPDSVRVTNFLQMVQRWAKWQELQSLMPVPLHKHDRSLFSCGKPVSNCVFSRHACDNTLRV
eukprot:s404_g7.t1